MSITLPLSNRPDMTMTISDEDADLAAYTWRMNGNYVGRSVTENGQPRLDYLHRVILQRMYADLPDGWQANHIDQRASKNGG